MSSVVIAGNTSGTVTLLAPDIAGTTTLTLPTTSGTLVTTAGGTTVPFALGSASSPSITFTGDTNTGIFSPGADTIAFAEGGVESMRIDSSGQVGINRTPSAGGGPLQVGFDSSGSAAIRIQTTNASTAGEILNFINSSNAGAGKVIFGTSQTSVAYQTTTGGQSTGAVLQNSGIAFPATQVASADANTLDDYEEGTWSPSINLLGTLTITSSGWYRKVGGLVTVFLNIVVTSNNTTQDGAQMAITNFPFAASSDVVCCGLLSERFFGGTNTISLHGSIGTGNTSLGLIRCNFNTNIPSATYYSGATRNMYTGGNLIISGQMSYTAS